MNSLKSKVIVLACLLFGIAFIAIAEEPRTRPNVATKTLGGMQIWEDLNIHAGWRVQRNIATGHARLLDDHDIRRAWGTVEACEGALREAKKEYGVSVVQEPEQGYYDAIILAVSHKQFTNLGVDTIRSYGKPVHVLYDVKYLLPACEVDGRL